MKGIWQWLKSSSKMKRWIFLILLGIILTCYGIAEILVQKEMEFIHAGQIILIFVLGFTFIVLGLIFLNKRNMELFIEVTDDRMKRRKNVNVNSLIFDKKIFSAASYQKDINYDYFIININNMENKEIEEILKNYKSGNINLDTDNYFLLNEIGYKVKKDEKM